MSMSISWAPTLTESENGQQNHGALIMDACSEPILDDLNTRF